jgi:integrase/recombinase XerD
MTIGCLCPWAGLAEYLEVCEHDGVDPVTATRAHLAVFVRELTTRPSRRGANVVSIDSGAGLANATLQQRLVAVPLFYDFLIEEGLDRAGCCCRRI